ncbi:MAG: hypothetical protein JWP34_5309 [Massilia sp.]|nr:hypothetical protein [Massilia sp.]
MTDNDRKTLTKSQLKKIEQLAEQAKCLPGMLSSLPYLSSDLTIGGLIACLNFAEDIDRALNDMLKVGP